MYDGEETVSQSITFISHRPYSDYYYYYVIIVTSNATGDTLCVHILCNTCEFRVRHTSYYRAWPFLCIQNSIPSPKKEYASLSNRKHFSVNGLSVYGWLYAEYLRMSMQLLLFRTVILFNAPLSHPFIVSPLSLTLRADMCASSISPNVLHDIYISWVRS